jgi:FlaA1/EpsC-like NDP-sugar epimerase
MKTKVTRNLLLILLLDALLLLGSFYLSHLIRFDFNPPDWAMVRFRQFLPVVVVLKLVCFYWLGLYKGMWRYTGMADLINVIKAATIASLCFTRHGLTWCPGLFLSLTGA